jgi:hypothetical protein
MRRWLMVLGQATAAIPMLGASAFAAVTPNDVHARLGALRLPFIANEGQADKQAAYYAPTFGGTLFVTRKGELVYSLPGVSEGVRGGDKRKPRSSGWTLTETLRGGRPHPAGEEPSATGVSYFVGNDPARWRATVATYEQVTLGEVWPGVRVSLHARGRGIEKIFTVQPGASVDRIRVRVSGADGLAVGADGALVARTGLGPVTFTAPSAYQERDGVRRPVAVAYRLEEREYGFTVGPYDRSKPLVIDPILQSSYFGGTTGDGATAMALHPATGDVYVAGYTQSSNFPHTLGGVLPTPQGGAYDGFVARFNGSLTTFIQATYLGGSKDDFVSTLAIHPANGDIYVAGLTESANFSGAGGGAQPAPGGGEDAFVARLSPSLTALVQATYLGGTGADAGNGLAIHPTTGDVYLAGHTSSTNFPNTAGGALTTKAGGQDAFIARLNGGLTSLVQSTYLGGGADDTGASLAIHPTTGDVYVGGATKSTNFPATGLGAQPTYGGGEQDGFVARLSSSLVSLTQATYLGGSQDDAASSLAIHPMTGDVYVLGFTHSTNFPGTSGGAQPTNGGEYDLFVTRLTGSLTSLVQATYLGGSATEFALTGRGVTVHPITGEVYVTALTFSTNLPGTSEGAQPTGSAIGKALVARLTASLTTLVQATYLGGNSQDSGYGVAIHPTTGDVYVVGDTLSTNFPGVAGGGQSTYGGNNDGFVSRLTYSLAAVDGLGLSALVNKPTFTVGQTVEASIGVINPSLPGATDVYIGTLRPDGVVEYLTNGGVVLGTLNTPHPAATGVPLSTAFTGSFPHLYTHQFTASDPRGSYTFFFGALSGSNLIGLATATYTFP